ncbi:monooxygenase 2 isoform X1 [Quercus suber]|uniref:monooxygenase 2 isoform X1 n=1 Tax=Quercus suber TaxID=58331 RepID=UPI0032DEDD3F
MEVGEDIVIVGAGIAGLTTSLGLHKLGIRSLVLESSDELRTAGYALTLWTNAWKALDAVGIGDSLRLQHDLLDGNVSTSTLSGLETSNTSFKVKGNNGDHEVRRVKRNLLLEAIAKELPSAYIRYSSKVVSIEEAGFYKLVHLADGTTYKTKVLIGCDGVNSVVAKWLGFKAPTFTGRASIRGCVNFKSNHGFEPKFFQFFGKGFRSGFLPYNDIGVYWFLATSEDKEREDDPIKMKQFVLSKLGNVYVPDQIKAIVENTELDSIISSPLRYRHPWELLWGNINKDNVCVAGDALHPMTPDLGQGGCAALEDSVVLARCLAGALLKEQSEETKGKGDREREEYKRIEMGLKKYAKERRWRSMELISTAYFIGFINQGNGQVTTFLRDNILPAFLAGLLLKRADFDCGKLRIS